MSLDPSRERIDKLQRGDWRIIQHRDAPCFAVDAVALAAFVRLRPGERVFELGCGSGAIALLLCYEQPLCHITGLELMAEMADMARRSVTLNGQTERMNIVTGDVAEADILFGRDAADVVVCNPPYYACGTGLQNQNELFAAARSERYGTLAVWLDSIARLLKVGGRLYMVYGAARAGELFGALEQRRLHLETLRFIQPYANKPANLLLAAVRKHGHGETVVLPSLTVYDAPGRYSREMEDIYAGNTVSGVDTDR